MGAKCEARVRNKANWPRLEAEERRLLGYASTLRRFYTFTREPVADNGAKQSQFPAFLGQERGLGEKTKPIWSQLTIRPSGRRMEADDYEAMKGD